MRPPLIAIDPGTDVSAVVIWDGAKLHSASILENHRALQCVRLHPEGFTVAVEMVACYGMPVGREVFETCLVIGRIQEICASRNVPCRLVYRRDVKLHHCGTSKAKDANIRQSLIDKYGAPGVKKAQGVTYGIKSHLWAAFAVATYVTETGALIEIKGCA